MPVETQTSFAGGLNTRFPAHKIPDNAVQEALNCDFSYGDVRQYKGIGGEGGGSSFFYEAGNTWVGADGVGGQSVPIQVYTTDTTISSSATFGTPLTVNQNVTLTVASGQTLTVQDSIRGLHGSQSFIEYAEDTYIAREDFEITATTVYANTLSITLSSSDIFKIIEGDELITSFTDSDTKIRSINTAANTVTLTRQTTNGSQLTNETVTIRATPVRIIDGNTSVVTKLGLDTPQIGFEVFQPNPGDQASFRDFGHSVAWVQNTPPVVFRYGLAKYDDLTLAESGMSALSDLSQAQSAVNLYYNDVPVFVNFRNSRGVTVSSANPAVVTLAGHGLKAGDRIQFTASTIPTGMAEGTDYFVTEVPNSSTFKFSTSYGGTNVATSSAGSNVKLISGSLDDGKYTAYRIGGTSAILKKAYNFFYQSNFHVTATTNAATVTFTIANKPSVGTVYARVLVYGSPPTRYSEGSSYVANESFLTKEVFFSGTSFSVSSNGNNDHYLDVIFYIKDTEEGDDRVYNLIGDRGGAVNVDDSSTNELISYVNLIDFQPDRNLVDIEPITDNALPPTGLKHIVEVNNFLFGAVKKRLHVTAFGRPNNWPLDGFIDFDSNITALASRGGECVVFTEFGMHRVYGNAHNQMRKVKVPTTEGCPEGLDKCVANLRDNLVFKSQSGISIFNGKDVQVLTLPTLDQFTLPDNTPINNSGGVLEDVYYLLGKTGTGYRVDFKYGSTKISKTDINASNLFYRGLTNKLYSTDGFIGGGSDLKFNLRTRDFDLGNIDIEKYLDSIAIVGENFKGTIQIFADDEVVETFTFNNAISNFNRTLYPSASLFGNRFSVRFEQCEGTLQSVSASINPIQNLQRQRFDSVEVYYTGSPSVEVKIDNNQNPEIPSTVLTQTNINKTNTSTLYFPAMTEGYVPHLIAVSDETNKILNVKYNTEAI